MATDPISITKEWLFIAFYQHFIAVVDDPIQGPRCFPSSLGQGVCGWRLAISDVTDYD